MIIKYKTRLIDLVVKHESSSVNAGLLSCVIERGQIMEFQVEKNRIYALDASGKLLVEVTFPALEGNIVAIDHTFVDDTLRGKGIAGLLLQKTVEALRSTGRKARPTCSYAVSWFQKHPEAADVLASSNL